MLKKTALLRSAAFLTLVGWAPRVDVPAVVQARLGGQMGVPVTVVTPPMQQSVDRLEHSAAFRALSPEDRYFVEARVETLRWMHDGAYALDSMLNSWGTPSGGACAAADPNADLQRLIHEEPISTLILPPLAIDLRRLTRAEYEWMPMKLHLPWAPAERDLRIDGRTLRIQSPGNGKTELDLQLPTPEQMAEALAFSDRESREQFDLIVLHPGPSPENAKYATVSRCPGFEASASVRTGSANALRRQLDVWATRGKRPLEELVLHVTHEGEHRLLEPRYEGNEEAWSSAPQTDLISESAWATSGPAEDRAYSGARLKLLERQRAAGQEIPDELPERYARLRASEQGGKR